MDSVLIILQGLPGSGKSTFAKKIKSLDDSFVILSKDDLRIKSGVYVYEKSSEGKIAIEFDKLIDENFKKNKNLIIDNLNLSESFVNGLYKKAKENNYIVKLVKFGITNEGFLATRNTHGVSESDIKNLKVFLENKFNSDEVYFINSDKEQEEKAKIVLLEKKNKESRKATQLEIQKRINEVAELHLNGYSRKAIVQYCTENYGISERHVDNLLAKVYELISEKTEEFRTKLIKQSVRRFNDLYDKNTAIQDYRECRAVQDSIIKLFGLSAPDKIDHTTKGGAIETIKVTYKQPDAD